MKHWSISLPKAACDEAVGWARTQPSYEAAWEACDRGDWMLWIVGRLVQSKPWSEERKPIVRCAIECARVAGATMPRESRDALDVIERWCDGDATLDEAKVARLATTYAAYAAAAATATAAAAAAANAANAAAAAAAAAAYAAAKKRCAAIVRKHFPTPPMIA